MEMFELRIEDVEKYKIDMVTMLNQSFEKSFPNESFDVDSYSNRIESLKSYIKENKAIVYAIKQGLQLAGFVWFFEKVNRNNKVIHINHFVVHEKYRRLGIGQRLLEEVQNYAKKEEIEEIELFVTKDNDAAVNFYENKNFEVERIIMKKEVDKVIDIYFEHNYGKLYEKKEDGICEIYELESSLGKVYHMFIKRKIPLKVNNKTYYDLVTPYGYGGPLIINCKEGYRKELVQEFEIEFQEYCRKNNIVSEFVRFHPIIGNGIDFGLIYEIDNIRKTVGTNIHDFEDPITSEFSKSTRKSIRKALNSGLSYKVTASPNNLNAFKEIYYSTMDRNSASDYYYFDDYYFDSCLNYFKDNIILVEVAYEDRVISAGFYFVYEKMIHAHLSGTLKEYLHLSPGYIIKYATAIWAIENDVKMIHYGGGKSSEKDDQLYLFKKKFGKNTDFDFYIGKKIWHPKIYNELSEVAEVTTKNDFFPAYRA